MDRMFSTSSHRTCLPSVAPDPDPGPTHDRFSPVERLGDGPRIVADAPSGVTIEGPFQPGRIVH